MHSTLSMKPIRENKFEHLSDLHKPDDVLRISQKMTEAKAMLTLQMPNWSSWDLNDTELAVKEVLR